MTSRERMCKVLNHEIPDRLPTFEYAIDKKVIQEICPGGDFADLVEELGLDAITAWEPSGGGYAEGLEERKPGDTFLDDWGVTRKANTEMLPYPLDEFSPVKTMEDLKKFEPPDPYREDRYVMLRKYIDRFKGRTFINYMLFDVFETAKNLMGLENFLISSFENLDLIRGVYELGTEWVIEVCRKAIDIGADMINLAGDIGYNSGTFIDPKVVEEIHIPSLKKIVNFIKQRRAYVFNHCHGNVYEVLDSLANSGIDVLHPIDPEAGMDISAVHKIYRNHIVVGGNVSTDLLSRGSAKDVIESTKHLIDATSFGGSYIVMAASSLHSAVKGENYRAMVETVQSYGEY